MPEFDRAAIAAALDFRADAVAAKPQVVDISTNEVDHHWAGPPYAESLYQASLELIEVPPTFIAGVQQTVDVRVKNLGATTWRWGSQRLYGYQAWLPLVEWPG